MTDLSSTSMDREGLFRRLAQVIASDAALFQEGWKELVLVSEIEAGTPDMTGFCYTDDGRAVPVAPADFTIFDAIEALRDAMAHADGKSPWLAAFFRIKRETGKLSAEFEYHRPERWRVTPANVKERAREFAP